MKYLICMLVDDSLLKEPDEPELTPAELIAEFKDDMDAEERDSVICVAFMGAQAEELGTKLQAEYNLTLVDVAPAKPGELG